MKKRPNGKTDGMQDKLFEAIVNLTRNEVESNVQLGPNLHAPIDASEIQEVERIVLRDSKVQAAVAECQLPKGTVVVCEPWIYGTRSSSILCRIEVIKHIHRF